MPFLNNNILCVPTKYLHQRGQLKSPLATHQLLRITIGIYSTYSTNASECDQFECSHTYVCYVIMLLTIFHMTTIQQNDLSSQPTSQEHEWIPTDGT